MKWACWAASAAVRIAASGPCHASDRRGLPLHPAVTARRGRAAGFSYVGITAGALHRRVGGYPGTDHRMPVCCAAMRGVMGPSDRIVEQPPSGNGASLLIQYALPRLAGDA